ncbi:glycosyltransferase family 39 protein [Niabella drilacis]|uniref:Dolichyl-phosphate-mannose-protein mannosyltransferase n=1 Tax=Niabella drilacis (strain DSM 25811 / CCM 8410 / CCUG 62505 / LMG 26954 / E90) TaxID=1285928 RepID=A0A1G7AW73_NIADE|nr:glycosyltransferase family 39 protein [Niabella drilacis]SDE19124.1 Dolichyl-phosphate-mannose-protein mannosyltransferase [Niabella drilacis]
MELTEKGIQKTLFYAIYLLVAAALCIGVLMLLGTSYDAIVHRAVAILQRPDLEQAIRAKYFSPRKFKLFKAIFIPGGLALLVLMLLALFRFGPRMLAAWIGGTRLCCRSITAVFKAPADLTGVPRCLFWSGLLVYLVKSVVYIFWFPAQHDELWNYNTYIVQPFYYSCLVRNNYPLHNLILNLADLLPFENKEVLMRLPNLLIGTALYFFTFYGAKKISGNAFLAACAAILMSVMPVVTFYTLYARGTLLALLLSALFLYAAYRYVIYKNRSSVFWIVVATVLGFYSIPTFLFPFVIGVFFIIAGRGMTRQVIKGLTAALLLVALLYLPMLLGVGGSGIIRDAAGRLPFHELALVFKKFSLGVIAAFMGGAGEAVGIFLLLLTPFFYGKFKTGGMLWALLMFPFYSFWLLGYHVPVRAMPFVVVPVVTAWVLLIGRLQQVNRLCAGVVLLVLVAMYHWKTHNSAYLNWSVKSDREGLHLRTWLVQEQKNTLIDHTRSFFYYYPSIDYYTRQKNAPVQIVSGDPRSNRYLPGFKADSLHTVWVVDKDSAAAVARFKGWRYRKAGTSFIFYR